LFLAGFFAADAGRFDGGLDRRSSIEVPVAGRLGGLEGGPPGGAPGGVDILGGPDSGADDFVRLIPPLGISVKPDPGGGPLRPVCWGVGPGGALAAGLGAGAGDDVFGGGGGVAGAEVSPLA
jgi:hypothetical protein